jgi:hypothetical protein
MCTLVQALRLCTGRTAHGMSRGIALLFHDHGTRRGCGGSASRPGRFFLPGMNLYAISIVFKCSYFIFWPFWWTFTKFSINVVASEATPAPNFHFPTVGSSSSADAGTCETEVAHVSLTVHIGWDGTAQIQTSVRYCDWYFGVHRMWLAACHSTGP